jgi:superfamily II DNA or RNA helicase
VFDLRYYQEDATAAAVRTWRDHQAAVIVAATATGKTEIYLSLAVAQPKRVLVLAHRDYLLGQPIARLAARGFTDVAVEKAEERSEGQLIKGKIVFGSVASVSRPERLVRFCPDEFSLVVIDEGHRAVAPTYRRVIDHFRRNESCRFLILTATPKRKDNIALGNLCGGDIEVAYSYGPQRAIEEGWIAPLRFYRRNVKDLDFSNVRMKGNDLDPEQVEELLMQEGPLHEVLASLAEDRGPTVIFCPRVKVAHAYSTIMGKRYRPDRSAVLWQESSQEDRETVGKKLAQGEIDYVFNVDIVTEGYDVPELVRVVWAAPTASLVKFTQGTGRVFRLHSSLPPALPRGRDEADARKLLIAQSAKPVGHVVTYYPQNCRHQLCEPNDILGGDELPDEVRATAKQFQELTAAQPSGSDPEADVETAKALLELKALLEKRRQRIKATATVEDVEYDAFGGSRHRAAGGSAGAVRRFGRGGLARGEAALRQDAQVAPVEAGAGRRELHRLAGLRRPPAGRRGRECRNGGRLRQAAGAGGPGVDEEADRGVSHGPGTVHEAGPAADGRGDRRAVRVARHRLRPERGRPTRAQVAGRDAR